MLDRYDNLDRYDSALGLPRTPLTESVAGYAAELAPPFLFAHSMRSYLFAREIADARGLDPARDYDDELVFAACVLHDAGLTRAAKGGQRFEVDGADLAARFLAEQGVAADRVDLVWDAIALHTTPGIPQRKRPEVALVQAGTVVELFGRMPGGGVDLPAEFIDRVHAAFPRDDVDTQLIGVTLDHARRDPAGAGPMTFAGELLRQQDPHQAPPTFVQMVTAVRGSQ